MHDGKIRIMFVCYGNICRSPMAEYIFKKLAEDYGFSERCEIASAATSGEEIVGGVGNPVYPPARRELIRRGIGCGDRRFGLKKRITKISICSWGWTMATSLACAPFSAGIRIIRLKSLWILRAEATLQIRGTQAVSIRLFRTYSRACQHWRKRYSA